MFSSRLLLAATVAVVAVAVVSCGERAPLGPRSEPAAYFGDAVGALAACTPIASDSVTQLIGPAGGTLFVGPHVLRVPEGALSEPVEITAVAPSDTVNRIVFSPHGLDLAESAWLTMSYANCGVVNWLLPKRVAYTSDDLLQILEILLSFDNIFARRVTGRLDHFSTYAVAW